MRLPSPKYEEIFLWFIGIIASGLAISGPLLAASSESLNYSELLKNRGSREVIWSFDASMIQHNFSMPDNSKLSGNAGSFTFGYGRVRGNSWLLGRFHFLAGPWDTARGGAFDSDFYGSGIDFEYGTAFPGTTLRSGSSPILSLAAGYMDLNGRNIGANRKNNGNPNDRSNYYLEQDFKAGFAAVTVTPSVGWSWTKSERPAGNEVELLTTRVESAYLRLGAIIPLYSRARVEVIKRSESDSITQTPKQYNSTGMIRGYSLQASTGVWLGI